MVKLDVSLLRFLENEDFRVLTALEMTMRNHDVAPTALIERIAQLPHGGCRKRLQNLLKHKMIHHENTMYDGFAMKYTAYDYLALSTLSKRGTVAGVGHRIGCGKESDIILVQDEAGRECVLKLQRLGRCSFRTVSRNRDYKNGRRRHGESWFYLSRLAAEKEYAFMRTLYDEGFPVPKPIDQNRHALLMELVGGTTLNNINVLGDAELVYRRCLDLMVKLAEHGLIHGDFNEFNLMVTEELRVIVIDFPQMVSTNHPNASDLFDRDVHNLANFFHRRFKVKTLFYPTLENDVIRKGDLDRVVFASGCFSRKQQSELERLLEAQQVIEADETESESGGEEDNTEEKRVKEPVEVEGNDSAERDAGAKISYADLEVVCDEAKTGEDDSEVGDEESDSDARSIDSAINVAAQQRRQQHLNPNYLPDGTLNESHVRSEVRRRIRRKDNQQFDKGLHRNVQKGRQKQKIRRKLKHAENEGLFD
ncbi:Rio2, N-terminal/RIO1 family, putative [Trypanosoma equiperdum]|uniref:Serine/threonine-protein kinase RIO2 n=2 Tax=Trypanozoon TaxID=39700 RepID=Q583Q0_TRYB2|nr:hypothetical protein, conserved [Trypanosoma brucei brucei TREU927]AAX80987.1 hypothetical protein, conserved [Trypanosoma brucei]AAZ11846.1 hypothetical protein, conserved [Trypanosoma brucei brucei TREU927]SCU67681.1 Rio2, N-terminal/RIO1 family, putative [Trypanosoma equiperdum]